jgi:hypothetical protein
MFCPSTYLSQAVAQLRPKGFGIRIAEEKTADPTDFRLLRPRRERPATVACDELASSHVRPWRGIWR